MHLTEFANVAGQATKAVTASTHHWPVHIIIGWFNALWHAETK